MPFLTRRSMAWACLVFLALLFLTTVFLIDAEWKQLVPVLSSGSRLDREHCLQLSESYAVEDTHSVSSGQVLRKNVVVASFFGFHFDVYMALVWTLKRVLGQVPGAHVEVFANPFYYGFDDIVQEYGLYDAARRDPAELVSYVQMNPSVDTIILGTCEIDLNEVHSALLEEWDQRAPEQKFKLICMVHNVLDTRWQGHTDDWARREALRVVTLGEHVGKSFQKIFQSAADQLGDGGGQEYIPVDMHTPVLDVPNLPVKSANRSLSRAVIQGSFDTSRRDYYDFFNELIASLHKNPEVWGYRPLGYDISFVPSHQSVDPPFELALVGSGDLEVPPELAHVVSIHRGLDYVDFYALISGMDIVVPAFADNGYYEHQASSTVAMAVELDVPILATRRMRKAYGYIDDDRAVVTRPGAMSEVQALLALRSGSPAHFLEQEPAEAARGVPPVRSLVSDIEAMLSMGWVRDPADLRRYKERLWRDNEAVVRRLLGDM
ncbi:hypothetical protein PsYK624_008990 [Phanerochaete sordida]|uniref:Glycosyltransferase family 1 protein n=1 Tax=Phanerochaete sordida TaxID=48140 RepID=A0A9P3L8B5_9APHY|nr:hypothetical protein PsYK624_008990 [Phanerochaete sordida]